MCEERRKPPGNSNGFTVRPEGSRPSATDFNRLLKGLGALIAHSIEPEG